MKNQPTTTDQPILPMVALIGPTNAGKSTLFNRLTGSWQAVTANEKSTTRDRVYGEVEWQGQYFSLVDTGGLVEDDSELTQKVFEQMEMAIAEADLILFVYDSAAGLDDRDRNFLNQLRGKKNVWLVANKVDSIDRLHKLERLPNMGLPYYEVSAMSGRGTGDLLEAICHFLPRVTFQAHPQPVIAIVGRPNVGKSTLLNVLTESNRAVVSDVAGTTRDIVTEKITIGSKDYILADTAGVRRRGKIGQGPEAFSVKRTLTAIAQADMVIVVLDSTVGSTRGDLHLIYYANELGKPVLIVFNKADLLDHRDVQVHRHLSRFDQITASALKKQGVNQILDWIQQHTSDREETGDRDEELE